MPSPAKNDEKGSPEVYAGLAIWKPNHMFVAEANEAVNESLYQPFPTLEINAFEIVDPPLLKMLKTVPLERSKTTAAPLV